MRHPSDGAAFFTGNNGVLHGESGHSLIIPPANKSLIIGRIPIIASGFSGYCLW